MITNVSDAMEWIKNTFLYIRLRQNPSKYGMKDSDTSDTQALERYLRELCLDGLNELTTANICRYDDDDCFVVMPEKPSFIMRWAGGH